MTTVPVHSDEASYRRLVEAIADGAFAFVGAGVSRALGYPTWNPLLDLLHDLCARCGVSAADLDEIKATDALVRAHLYETKLTRARVLEEIVKLYGDRDEKTSPIHRALIDVGFDHYLTTNYDLGIEASHEVAGIRTRTLDLKEQESVGFLRAISSRKGLEKTILHIHGRVDRPETVVLALGDYRQVYNLNAKTQATLGNLLFVKSFVFIGYSLSDPPFNAILDRVASISGESDSPQHWAILPEQDDAGGRRLELKLKYNIEPIFYEVEDGRHDALVPLIAKLATDVASVRTSAGRLAGANIIDVLFGGGTPVTREQAEERLQKVSLPPSEKIPAVVVPSNPTEGQKTPTDLRIDAQVEVMKEGFFDRARLNFEELLKELPSDAEPRLRYRLHANIGHCLFQLDRRSEVVPHYEAAYGYAPDKPDAMWMHAFVAEMQGNLPEAVARAEKLCKEHPTLARGHTVRIRCSPSNVRLLALKRSTPRAIRRDAEVAVALGDAADKRGDLRAAEGYARQAAKVSPDWGDAHTLVGASVMKREMGGDQPSVDHRVVPLNRARVEEAVQHFTDAISLMRKHPSTPRLAIAYVNRSGAKRLLGDDEGAFLDAAAAYEIAPSDVKVATKYAHALGEEDRFDEAVEVIEGLDEWTAYTPARFIRLLALADRGRTDDLERAVSEAVSLVNVTSLDEIERADAHAILCNLYVAQGEPERAIDHLRRLDPAVLSPGLRDARLAAFLFRLSPQDADEAINLLTQAVVAARSVAPWFVRREIANICGLLRRFRDAADILATIISPNYFSEESEDYLDCLLRSKQYGSVREYCRTLRRSGQYTVEALHAESDALLAVGESKEATEVLGEWLAWRPDDKIAHLYRSAIFIERGETSLVNFDPALLPSIEEIRRPRDGVQVVHVLSHGPDQQAAADYAYRLARKYPEDEQVQFALISALMMRKSAEQKPPRLEVVDVRHAVTLRSDVGNGRRVIKLIDDQVQNADEFHISHEVAQSLLGKRVGERVRLGSDEMVIESVVANAALAAKDAIDGFNLRFPKSKLIQTFKVPDAPANPTSPREVLGEQWWQMLSADDQATAHAFDLYQNGQVPLTMVARRRGKSIFETSLHVLNSPELDVLSVPEHIPLVISALRKVQAAKAVVIDSTALATLLAFEMSPILKELPFDFIVPDSALQEVRKAKYDAERGLGSHRAGLKDGKFFMTEVSSEAMTAWANTLQKLIDDVQAVAKVVGGSAREKVTFPHGDQLADSLGEPAFDAIAIASEHKAVLWTDDQMFGRVANDLCGVSPVWTQALLHVADERAKSKKRWRGRFLPELLLYRFRGTVVIVLDVVQSLKRFRWKVGDPHLSGVCEHLKKFGCTPKNYQATRELFVFMWVHAGKRNFNRVTRAIWVILGFFDRAIAKKFIARALYKPSSAPYRKFVPAFSRFRNVLRIWATAPEKTEVR